MKKLSIVRNICLIVTLYGLFAVASANADNLKIVSTYYYPASWNMGSAYSTLSDLPQANQKSAMGHQFVVNLAYKNFDTLPNSIQFDPEDGGNEAIQAGIKKIHQNGGKVVIAFGGWGVNFGIFPNNDSNYYKTLYKTAKDFGFDGIDFDDENVNGNNADGQMLAFAIPALRDAANADSNSSFILSFAGFMSGAAPGWGNFLTLLQNPAVQSAVTYVNVMDYEDTSKWCANGYTVPATLADLDNSNNCYLPPLSEYQTALGGNASKIMMGIMIGKQTAANTGVDPTQVVSPDNIEVLAQYAEQQGFAGIQYWDSDRDTQSSDFTKGTDYPTGSYFKAIETVK